MCTTKAPWLEKCVWLSQIEFNWKESFLLFQKIKNNFDMNKCASVGFSLRTISTTTTNTSGSHLRCLQDTEEKTCISHKLERKKTPLSAPPEVKKKTQIFALQSKVLILLPNSDLFRPVQIVTGQKHLIYTISNKERGMKKKTIKEKLYTFSH